MTADPGTLIAELRALKEADALHTQARIKAFLDAAAVAIPVVFFAASMGHVASKRAALEIVGILGIPLNPAPAGPNVEATEETAAP